MPIMLSILILLACSSVAFAHPLDGIILPTLREYFVLGVEHILGGYDHLLFVAGLVIASFKLRELVWTISAFTVAHSITLGLGMLGVVTPSSVAVELLIALSIAYVGYENLRARGGAGAPSAPPGRIWLVMVFGLAHGFGFAGAIADVGLPVERKLGALAFFNLGVEAGQLVAVALLWPVLAFVRKHARLELGVVRVVNVCLIVAGIGWTLERSLVAPEPHAAGAAPAIERAVEQPKVRAVIATPAWVSELCHALQVLPRERRAQCAGVEPGVTLVGACERALSVSVASASLRVDAERTDRCVAAMRERYEGCAWTEARVLPPEPACQGLIEGTQGAGDECGSTLECEAGLYCHGAGAFDRGICGPPRQNSARCELAADPLASYIPTAGAMHPECEGQCVRGRCTKSSGS